MISQYFVRWIVPLLRFTQQWAKYQSPETIVEHECCKGDSNSGRAVRRQPICQAAFNGKSGNNGDASVHADGAKSRCLKRVDGALRRRNSLHTAIQTWGGVCPGYQYRDCCPHSAHTEQSGETAPLTFPSQLSQIYRPNSAQREQSGETALLISLSQRFHSRFVARPNVGRVYSRSDDAVIRVYDEAGNVIETHEHTGEFKEW
jgi:hypothetical protein